MNNRSCRPVGIAVTSSTRYEIPFITYNVEVPSYTKQTSKLKHDEKRVRKPRPRPIWNLYPRQLNHSNKKMTKKGLEFTQQ
jgi:hypothetical protein